MGDVNIKDITTVKVNGVDVTNKLLSYSRDQNICTSVGTLELNLVDDGTDYDAWDEVHVYENDDRVGIFYAHKCARDAKTGIYTLSCQDGSKKLTDYFIDESFTIETYSTTLEWLTRFLSDAGVDYTIRGNEQVPMSTNSQIGMTSAYDAIIQLLQYTGYYMYFDGNGTAIVGPLTGLSGGVERFSDTEILSIKKIHHDKMLRNRAVVWGNTDPDTGEWVFADLSINTPWNYDASDLRAVVLSNHQIPNNAEAEKLARKLLNTFARINDEKELSVIGLHNLHVGKFVRGDTNYFDVTGMITTLNVTVSSNGAISNMILDEKCPRLFAFFEDYDDYVYIGTDGSGVWRKPLHGAIWENYSSGIASSGVAGVIGSGYATPPSGIFITDLYVANDQFCCVESGGLSYFRTPYVPWSSQAPPAEIYDAITSGNLGNPGELVAVACTINHLNNMPQVVYNSPEQYKGSWVIGFSGTQGTEAYQVYVESGFGQPGFSGTSPTDSGSKIYTVSALDIDTNDKYNFVTVEMSGGTELIAEYTVSGMKLGHSSGWEDVKNQYTKVIIPKDNFPINADSVNGTDYFDSTFRIEYSQSYYQHMGPVLTARIDDDNTYVYYFKDSSSGLIICRAKCDFVNDTWDIISFPATGISNLYFSQNTYSKTIHLFREPVDPDLLWISVWSASGYFEFFKADFISMTVTLETTSDGYSNVTATGFNEEKAYVLYYERDGFYNDHFKLDSINIKSGNSETTELGTHQWGHEGLRYYGRGSGGSGIYFGTATPSMLAPKPGGGIIYVGIYQGSQPSIFANERVGVGYYYGNESKIYFEKIFDDNGEVDGEDAYTNSDNSYYLGQQADNVYIQKRFDYVATWKVNDIWYRSRSYVVVSIDASLNKNIIENANGTFSDTLGGLGLLDPPSQTYSEVGFVPLPSKKLDHGYLMSVEFDNSTNSDVFKLYDIFTMTNEVVIKPDPELEPFHYVLSGLDDLDDMLYIQYNDGLLCYDIEGTLQWTIYWSEIGSGSYDNIPIVSISNMIIVQRIYINSFNTTMELVAFTDKIPRSLYRYETKYYVVQQDKGIFTTVLEVSGEYKLDISDVTPLEIFVPATGSSTPLSVFQSDVGASGTWKEIEVSYPTFDIRSTQFISSSGNTLASGAIESGTGKYVLIATSGAINGFPVSLSGAGISIANFSGVVTHLETSNHLTYPYIFASVSGYSGQEFYQKNPVAGSGFINYSATLPGAAITIIRLDDRV